MSATTQTVTRPATETMDLGNNERMTRGVFFEEQTGEWLALTYNASKTFKTERGAINWYNQRVRR